MAVLVELYPDFFLKNTQKKTAYFSLLQVRKRCRSC